MRIANYDLFLKDDWLFHYGELERLPRNIPADYVLRTKTGTALVEYHLEEAQWEAVTVPHDWLTGLSVTEEADSAGGFKKRETGWYYTKFTLTEDTVAKAKLVFDGVLGECTVYVNGVIAGRNFSGYNRFALEIGDYLIPSEENTIVLYVDARRQEGWWYEGAGIYRPVYIQFREENYIDYDECFIRSEKADGVWSVNSDFTIVAEQEKSGNDLKLCVTLQDTEEKVIACEEAACMKSGKTRLHMQFPVLEPKLWSPETPHLYKFCCELKRNGEGIDKKEYFIGLRRIEWKANEGMYLNGNPYEIKGICCHQDHAGVGAAVTREIMEYRIRKLKELGVNTYRCVHHAPAEELLEICDRLGMLVMVENRHFSVSEDTFKEVDALVSVSRNHSSVFLYSVFNEEPWQRQERGKRIAEKLKNRILARDDTRAITCGQNGGHLREINTSQVMDVVGFNYFLHYYEGVHERMPEKILLGTENCPTFATRGVYKTDREKQIFAAYGDEYPSDFAESFTDTMKFMKSKSYVAGCFVWSGFDHRGETNPFEWPSVISHWGLMDTCGFPKDTAYLLAAWYKENLFVHLLPHWNWNNGDEVRVCAFTNGESAELFVNGKSYGTQTIVDRRAEWIVPFEAGEIAVCAVKNDVIARNHIATAGTASKLLLEDVTPDVEGGEVHIFNIYALDEKGVVVPNYDKMVHFEIQNGRILGVGNGDPNGHHPDIADSVPLFHGCAQIIISGKDAKLKASCEGLNLIE